MVKPAWRPQQCKGENGVHVQSPVVQCGLQTILPAGWVPLAPAWADSMWKPAPFISAHPRLASACFFQRLFFARESDKTHIRRIHYSTSPEQEILSWYERLFALWLWVWSVTLFPSGTEIRRDDSRALSTLGCALMSLVGWDGLNQSWCWTRPKHPECWSSLNILAGSFLWAGHWTQTRAANNKSICSPKPQPNGQFVRRKWGGKSVGKLFVTNYSPSSTWQSSVLRLISVSDCRGNQREFCQGIKCRRCRRELH